MDNMDKQERQRVWRRQLVFFWLIASIVIVIVARLAVLQVINGKQYVQKATSQSVRKVSIPAARGIIYDRNGEVLATNRPAYTVFINYTQQQMTQEQVKKLAGLLAADQNSSLAPATSAAPLKLPADWYNQLSLLTQANGKQDPIALYETRITKALQAVKANPLDKEQVAVDINPAVATAIREDIDAFPGVTVSPQPVRYYPNGDLAAHVLGYVSSISKQQEKYIQDHGLANKYSGVKVVGRSGVEALGAFDQYLQGTNGSELIAVNAYGREIQHIGEKPPVPGDNLHLTIDAGLQQAAKMGLQKTLSRLQQGISPQYRYKGLPVPMAIDDQVGKPHKDFKGATPSAKSGAVVVLDVHTGAVLAMASYPSFNPNYFALAPYLQPGTSRMASWNQYYTQLATDSQRPLINKVISGTFPPGSTFKPLTALVAERRNQVIPKVDSVGIYKGFRDWTAHGWVNLVQAIEVSSDEYFYHQGEKMMNDHGNTTLAAAAKTGDQWISVQSTSGLWPGDVVQIGTKGTGIEERGIARVDRQNNRLEIGPVEGQLAFPKPGVGALGQDYPKGIPVTEINSNPVYWLSQYFGLGEPTNLQGIAPGIEKYGKPSNLRPSGFWTYADSFRSAIGQYDYYSLMQLGHYAMMLANHGKSYQPYLVQSVTSPDGKVVKKFKPNLEYTAPVSDAAFDQVTHGMLLDTTGPRGTARLDFADWNYLKFPIQTAGKTGTASIDNGVAHALYISFAPAKNPQIAIAVIVEHGNGGGRAAAPVARAILDQYFNYVPYYVNKMGLNLTVPKPFN